MKHDSTAKKKSGPGAPARRRPRTGTRARTGTFLIGVLTTIAAGCGGGSGSGPNVASVGTTTTVKGAAANQSAKASPIAFSKCMRAHGVTKFPDPNASGGLTIQAGPGTGLDPNSAVFIAAQKACQSLMPQPSAAERQKAQAQQLKYSQCMRAHGVTDFPDPNADGGIQIEMRKGSALDPNSPVFKAAQASCEKELPGGPKGVTTAGGGPGGGTGNAGFGTSGSGK